MPITNGEQIVATDFIDESERDATPANDEGRVPKLEDNGQIANAFLQIYNISTSVSYSSEIAPNFALFGKYEATAQDDGVSIATPLNMPAGSEITISLKMVNDETYTDNDNFLYVNAKPTTLDKDYVYTFTITRLTAGGYSLSWERYMYINKSIKFVGSASQAGGTSATISLTSLTGGIGTSAIENDVVMILVSSTDITQTISLVTSGFTQLDEQREANDTRDSCSAVFYKVMGGTPDTSVEVTSTGSYAIIAYVMRGVNPSNPIASPTVGNALTNSNHINPNEIDEPGLSGSYIFALGAGSNDTNSAVISTTPSGYTNNIFRNSLGGNVVVATFASARWDPESAGQLRNPGEFTQNSGGSNESSTSFTIALTPADE